MPRVVVVGWSTRAMADSAARAGFDVTAVDAFADLDQHPGVTAIPVQGNTGDPPAPHALARAACAEDGDAVVYSSPLENYRRSVAALARGRLLWGNPPETLRVVRDPVLVMRAFERRGFGIADVIEPNARDGRVECLLKPLASGGGRGVRSWRRGSPVPKGWYLQRRIEGSPGSIVFLAAGGRAIPLGVSRQLVGDPAFGASGYRYCGNILAAEHDGALGGDPALISSAMALAHAAAAEFRLVGINGIDFIASHGAAIPIEINPRWPASVELVERAFSCQLFGAHAEACTSATLPHPGVSAPAVTAIGKAVVFARADVIAGDTRSWLRDPDVRDIPRPHAHIREGRPVCTVFARADTAERCYAALVERAAAVYAALKG